MPRLEGRVAIVTGAGSGMGLEMSRRFAEEGASVVAAEAARPTSSRGFGRKRPAR